MTAKIVKVLVVVLVLATVLLAGNALVGGRASSKCDQAGVCCPAANAKACPLNCVPSCCQAKKEAQTCPAVDDPTACPAVCPKGCCDEPCCLKTEGAAGCSAKEQKPCCASR